MNERIKELAKQAGCSIDGMGLGEGDVEGLIKLVVQECIAACDEVAENADAMTKSKFVTDAGRMLHEGMWGGAQNCKAGILNRVGVEL